MIYEKGFDGLLFPQPSYVADYGKWLGKVTIPKDGDPNNEFTFAGILDLTDRTMWLAWRCIDIRGGGTYANAPVVFTGFWRFEYQTEMADLRLIDGSWPGIYPARSWERHGLELMGVTHLQESDPDDPVLTFHPDAWVDFASGEPFVETRPMMLSTGRMWLRIRDLPDGGSLTGVTISTKGLGVVDASTLATYRLGRRKGRAAINWVAAAVTDVHNAGNYTTTELDTTVFSGAHTIEKDYVYFVEVTLPYNVGSPGEPMRVYNLKASGTALRLGL